MRTAHNCLVASLQISTQSTPATRSQSLDECAGEDGFSADDCGHTSILFHALILQHGDQPCMPVQLTSDCCRAGKKQSARLGRCFRCRALRDGQQCGSASRPGPSSAQLYETSSSW